MENILSFFAIDIDNLKADPYDFKTNKVTSSARRLRKFAAMYLNPVRPDHVITQ